jgi:hypothetical protein
MKKVLVLLAMSMMVVGLTGCLDNPDDSKQRVVSSVELMK